MSWEIDGNKLFDIEYLNANLDCLITDRNYMPLYKLFYIVNAILDEVGDAMAKGDRVELRGFGAFSVKNRPARVGRNPRTGETVDVGEKYVPQFKAGKEIRERINRAG